jgi:Pentapeptide repeats (9 copies)
LAVSFTVAVVGLAGLAWLAWVLLGLAGYRRHGPPALKDAVSVLQLVFATVAGAGALVALIVAYRRQKVAEADSIHDRTRVFNERFTAIAAQLGDAQPAVRLAGVHAMAGLADDWKQNRQTCVDVLCAYLRLPYDPDPGDDAVPATRTAYRAYREVRHTIIRLIGTHLRPGAAVSWQGLTFDFNGVIFDGGDFRGAEFSSGLAVFDGAEFCGGIVRFNRAKFSGAEVYFGGAKFSGGEIRFVRSDFSGGTVSFRDTELSSGTIRFDGAGFSGSTVNFNRAKFSGGKVSFDAAQFSGGEVSFSGAMFSGGEVSFFGAKDWSHPPTFSWEGKPPAGVVLPVQPSEERNGKH